MQVALADSVRMLFEMREDPLYIPAAAQVMPDHHVKGVAAVDTFWGTVADDLLDLKIVLAERQMSRVLLDRADRDHRHLRPSQLLPKLMRGHHAP